jgi:hypothetical protein
VDIGPFGPFWHPLTSSSEYTPHRDHLYLHNGALSRNEDPCSDQKPIGRSRARRTVDAKTEASKRLLDLEVAKQITAANTEDGTPRKKV